MEIREVRVKDIQVVENIRQAPLKEDLTDLMESIKANGLLQPIGVKEARDGYLLIWGFRRLTAFKKLGYNDIPAVIFKRQDEDLSEEDFLIINAVENLHQKNINLTELGRICKYFRKKNMSTSEIASKLSIPKSRVKIALDSFGCIPDKYRDKVSVIPSGKRTKGVIGSITSSAVIRLRNVTKEQREDVFDWVRAEEKTALEVQILGSLIREGMALKEAMNQVDKYKLVEFRFAVNKQIYEDNSLNDKGAMKKLVKTLVNKEYKNLIF